jgi:hypothetical protein
MRYYPDWHGTGAWAAADQGRTETFPRRNLGGGACRDPIGPSGVEAEAGIASTMLRLPAGAKPLQLTATDVGSKLLPLRQVSVSA